MYRRIPTALFPILAFCLTILFAICIRGYAQQPSPQDPTLDAASTMIGRALFFRCLCSENNLAYDTSGKLSANVKRVDWTLSGVNIQKVSRKGPDAIELQGVRVVVHFAPDRREFDRKPQDTETVHVTMLTNGDPAAFRRALHAAFSLGIDRELQLATPSYWQHYFDPSLKWPADYLTSATILSSPTPTPDTTLAAVTHRAEADYTPWASRAHIEGSIRLHFIVDTQGNARHIVLVTPLGYGLDEKAVEAVEKYHFAPATSNGNPIASNVTMDETFKVVPIPQ